MKEFKLNVSKLKEDSGTLKGGFASLTQKQMERINGSGNDRCTNDICGGLPGTNTGCGNMTMCNPISNEGCRNNGDCIKKSVVQ